jgi:hypothetical protein
MIGCALTLVPGPMENALSRSLDAGVGTAVEISHEALSGRLRLGGSSLDSRSNPVAARWRYSASPAAPVVVRTWSDSHCVLRVSYCVYSSVSNEPLRNRQRCCRTAHGGIVRWLVGVVRPSRA